MVEPGNPILYHGMADCRSKGLILTVGSLFKRGYSHVSSPNTGWVSVSKVFMPGGRVHSASVGNLLAGKCFSGNDEISLPTPEEGTAFRDLGAKGNKKKNVRGPIESQMLNSRPSPPDDCTQPMVVPQNQTMWRGVGIFVHSSNGGQDSLLPFVHGNDKENRNA